MNWIWNFYFYSFFGFLLEVFYARLIGAEKTDRKCLLFLPLCPVYGTGVVAILALPQSVTQRPALLFIAGGIAATAAEYLFALFYEKVWQVSFWDYSDLPGNLHGRVCLPFALIWGALSLGLVYWFHPRFSPLLSLLPDFLLIPLSLVFVMDWVITAHILRATKSTRALRWYME